MPLVKHPTLTPRKLGANPAHARRCSGGVLTAELLDFPNPAMGTSLLRRGSHTDSPGGGRSGFSGAWPPSTG